MAVGSGKRAMCVLASFPAHLGMRFVHARGGGKRGGVPLASPSGRHRSPPASSCGPCPQTPHCEVSQSQLADPACKTRTQGQLEE